MNCERIEKYKYLTRITQNILIKYNYIEDIKTYSVYTFLYTM